MDNNNINKNNNNNSTKNQPNFSIPFLFVDVGGQRTQRQKWFQCFDSGTYIELNC